MRQFASAAIAAVSFLLISPAMPAFADSSQDAAALSGLKEVKVAFDLQNGSSSALLKQLEVIEETRDSLIKQGVKPDIVITFRGPATKLVQTDASKIAAEDRENASKIAKSTFRHAAFEGDGAGERSTKRSDDDLGAFVLQPTVEAIAS